MRKALIASVGVIGLVVVFFAVMVVCFKLRQFVGKPAVYLVAMGFAAAWAATPESRRMAAKVLAALRTMRRTDSEGNTQIGMSLKEAALLAGMSEAQLSAQLSGREGMQLSRYAQWGPEWECAFGLQLLPATGLWIENLELADILRPLTQQPAFRSGAA
jgi:hypothetical protein